GRERMVAVAKAREDEIEPHYVRLKITECAKQPAMIAETVLDPAALHAELGELGFRRRQIVGHHGKTDQGIGLQLPGYVVSILAEHGLAGRESADKANLHGPGGTLKTAKF